MDAWNKYLHVPSLGVSAFVPKTAPLIEFDKAIDSVIHRNEAYLPASVTHLKRKKTTVVKLTEREKEMLPLFVSAKSSKEVAQELFVLVKTADFHKKNLFVKFEVKNMAELLKETIEQGFVGNISF